MLPRERPRRLELPEDARARLEEVVVEEALVVAPLPAALVELRERVAAPLHAREARFLHARLRLALHARLQACAHGQALVRCLDYHGAIQDAAEQLKHLGGRFRLDHLSLVHDAL
jgi:hypothetical protein